MTQGNLFTFVQVFWETEVIESGEFYLEVGLEKAIYQWHRGCLYIFVQVSQRQSHLPGDWAQQISRGVHWRWSWKGCSLVILGKTLLIHCSGLPGDRALVVHVLAVQGLILKQFPLWEEMVVLKEPFLSVFSLRDVVVLKD